MPLERESIVESLMIHSIHGKFHCYGWVTAGRESHRSSWALADKNGDHEKDHTIVKDCVLRVEDSTWWIWGGGSTPFFCRWPDEFRKSIQDGTPLWLDMDVVPEYRRPQRDEANPVRKRMVKEKLDTVCFRRYVESLLVSELTSFLVVMKGDDDIRMVFNGTLSGPNAALWDPWFCLPNATTHMRIVVPGTFMAYADIGEMFLNFFLDPRIRRFAGMDFTKFYPEELDEIKKFIWEMWNRCAMGFRPFHFVTIQALAWLELKIFGNRNDLDNVFRSTGSR
jgi:hypothetical protein